MPTCWRFSGRSAARMIDAEIMRRRGLGEEAFGGTPVGTRVELPPEAQEPITAYINGVEQTRGEDYDIKDGGIVFREPIYKEEVRQLNPLLKFGLALGLFGWYARNEVVDVQYQSPAGIKEVPDVPVLPAG